MNTYVKMLLRSIESKAGTISKYSMIEYGDKVAVGVSGGKDSLSYCRLEDAF